MAPSAARARVMTADRTSASSGVDEQEPFGVGLGRRDRQQRDELAGGGEPVLDQAVVREFDELFEADPGVRQDLDGGPGPERVVLLAAQVAALAAAGGLGPRPVGDHFRPAEGLPAGGEQLAGRGGAGGVQPGGGALAVLLKTWSGWSGEPILASFEGSGNNAS